MQNVTLNSLFAILFARRRIIIGTAIASVVLAVAVLNLKPKIYQATTDLIVDSRGWDPISGQSQPTRLNASYLTTQADIVRSRNVANRVVENLNLTRSPEIAKFVTLSGDAAVDRRRVAGFLAQGLEVTPKRDSNMLAISFRSSDPELAAKLANGFAQAYIHTNLELRTEPARQTTEWYNEQIAQLRVELVAKQDALSTYQEKHSILASSDRLDLESTKLAELSSLLIAAQNERFASKSRSDQIANTKRGQLETRALDNPQVQKVAADLTQAQARVSELANQVGENHPQYRQAVSEVESLRRQMNRLQELISGNLQSSVELSKALETQLTAELAAQKDLVLQLSRHRNELALLKQEVDNAQAAYDAALARTAQTRLESQISATDIATLNQAVPPSRPAIPGLATALFLATVAGILLGMGISLCLEWLDQRIRHHHDLERGLGLTILANIPAFGAATTTREASK